MKLPTALLALPLLASSAFGQVAADQKTYILAKEEVPLPIGRTFMAKQRMSVNGANFGMTVGGQKIEGKMSTVDSEDTIMEFLAADKIRVTYAVHTSTQNMNMMGQEQKDTKTEPTEGKVIALTLKDGKWSSKLEKGEVKEEEQEDFDKEMKSLAEKFNKDTDALMYGTKARKVGETWNVDASLMPAMSDMKDVEGDFTMTFVEVKEFQGQQCAVLKTSFKVKGLMTEAKMNGANIGFSGDGRIIRSLSLLRDLKFDGEGKISMDGKMELQPGMFADMVMAGPMKMNQQIAEKKAGAE